MILNEGVINDVISRLQYLRDWYESSSAFSVRGWKLDWCLVYFFICENYKIKKHHIVIGRFCKKNLVEHSTHRCVACVQFISLCINLLTHKPLINNYLKRWRLTELKSATCQSCHQTSILNSPLNRSTNRDMPSTTQQKRTNNSSRAKITTKQIKSPF